MSLWYYNIIEFVLLLTTIWNHEYDYRLDKLIRIYIFANYNIVFATRGYE